MKKQKFKNFNINITEYKNIQNKVQKEFWIDIKKLGLYILLGTSILDIMFIIVEYFPSQGLSLEKIIALSISTVGILSTVLFIIFIILSIKEHKQKIFEQISILILKQIPDLKITSKSIDKYEDFLDEGYDGDWHSKIRAANICIPFCKTLDNNFILNSIFIKEEETGSYLKIAYKNKVVQILNAKFQVGLRKLPYITLFRGIIIFIDKNKLFNGNYCIIQKNIIGLIRKPFANIPLLNIEHPLLKNFSVYADNNSGLDRILKPEFLNTFLNIKKEFKASMIDFGTNGKTIAILINFPQRRFGSLPLFRPLTEKDIHELSKQYNAILNFINTIE